jgi:hypothetical protein
LRAICAKVDPSLITRDGTLSAYSCGRGIYSESAVNGEATGRSSKGSP